MIETANSDTSNALPATPKQLAYARKLAEQLNVVLPWEIQQDRRALSQWIDTQRTAPRVQRHSAELKAGGFCGTDRPDQAKCRSRRMFP